MWFNNAVIISAYKSEYKMETMPEWKINFSYIYEKNS